MTKKQINGMWKSRKKDYRRNMQEINERRERIAMYAMKERVGWQSMRKKRKIKIRKDIKNNSPDIMSYIVEI